MSGLLFGISLATASCGWAVVRPPAQKRAGARSDGKIIAMGTWMFDAPETAKDRMPTSQLRRNYRLLRRAHRTRAQRKARLRALLLGAGLMAADEPGPGWRAGIDPWGLRVRGLDHPLEPSAFATALLHIARRRGFRSTRVGGETDAPGDDRKMLKALEMTRAKLAAYRTAGEMLALDPDLRDRKRNREGSYDRSLARDDLIREVRALFEAQRRMGNRAASPDLEAAFIDIAFEQGEMQDSGKLVGLCPFEPDHKRAARHAPSFERFRLLQKLVSLRIATADGERGLTPDELALAAADLGRSASLTARDLRKRIGLPDDHRFVSVRPDRESSDIVLRVGEGLHGTKTLREVLGDALWLELLPRPALLDEIARIMSFCGSAGTVAAELRKLALPDGAVEILLSDRAAFARFRGAGHISAQAARALIPHLEAGLRYDEACKAAGYDPSATRWSGGMQVSDKQGFNRLVEDLCGQVGNPVTRKALTEGLKQLWAMRHRWGLPDGISIALSRDLGASPEKRLEITRGIERSAAFRSRLREELCDLIKADRSDWLDADVVMRYQLWKEQEGRCPYTDRKIPLDAVLAGDDSFCLDYILPWSRFADDSVSNKVICTAQASRDKQGQTPFEWLVPSRGEDGWAGFAARIEGIAGLRGPKKRNLVLRNAGEQEERVRKRNLHETGYVARLFAGAVAMFYPPQAASGPAIGSPVVVRPAGLIAALRRAWQLDVLKGQSSALSRDARHLAIDALTAALAADTQIQTLASSFREWEQAGLARTLRDVDPPWGSAAAFSSQAGRAYAGISVAWPERRRARGEGHAATIRQVRQRDGTPVVFERRAIADLPEKRLSDIKDADRNRAMIEAIRQWMVEGRPDDRLPRSPAGHEIRKVRLRTSAKPAVPVRGGSADRGEIVRVDLFAKPNRRGKDQFYLVPVYPHQVMNKRAWPLPPMQAVAASKEEADWPRIDEGFRFLFSLYPRSFVEVEKAAGEVLAGYFQSFNRATGAISLFNDKDFRLRKDDQGRSLDGIGVKTALAVRKFQVDRFGRRYEVRSEPRTWHGRVCIPAGPVM